MYSRILLAKSTIDASKDEINLPELVGTKSVFQDLRVSFFCLCITHDRLTYMATLVSNSTHLHGLQIIPPCVQNNYSFNDIIILSSNRKMMYSYGRLQNFMARETLVCYALIDILCIVLSCTHKSNVEIQD